jgi:UDP-3-O-[3-hydroxymyristoyl] glucosamine N-acyltransferase
MAYTTAQICQHLGGRLVGAGDQVITGLAPPDRAGSGELTFLHRQAQAGDWSQSHAAAAVVPDGLDLPGNGRPIIHVSDVDPAMHHA